MYRLQRVEAEVEETRGSLYNNNNNNNNNNNSTQSLQKDNFLLVRPATDAETSTSSSHKQLSPVCRVEDLGPDGPEGADPEKKIECVSLSVLIGEMAKIERRIETVKATVTGVDAPPDSGTRVRTDPSLMSISSPSQPPRQSPLVQEGVQYLVRRRLPSAGTQTRLVPGCNPALSVGPDTRQQRPQSGRRLGMPRRSRLEQAPLPPLAHK